MKIKSILYCFATIAIFFCSKVNGQQVGSQIQDVSTMTLSYVNGPPADYSEGTLCTYHVHYQTADVYFIISVYAELFNGVSTLETQPQILNTGNVVVGANSYDYDIFVKYHGAPGQFHLTTYRRSLQDGSIKRNDWQSWNFF